MRMNPPPPRVGEVFSGPEIGHGGPARSGRPGKYYVRAVVDAEECPQYGWEYQVVLRFWTRKHGGGWRYEIIDAHAFGLGTYKRIGWGRRPAEAT